MSPSPILHIVDAVAFIAAVAMVSLAADSIFHAFAGRDTRVVVSWTFTAALDLAGVAGVLTTILGWLRLKREASYLRARNETLMHENQEVRRLNEAVERENQDLRNRLENLEGQVRGVRP